MKSVKLMFGTICRPLLKVVSKVIAFYRYFDCVDDAKIKLPELYPSMSLLDWNSSENSRHGITDSFKCTTKFIPSPHPYNLLIFKGFFTYSHSIVDGGLPEIS
jgi:hypothetical protein